MAWGVSGLTDRSEMVGADVAVAYYSEASRQAFVQDYNISAKAPVHGHLHSITLSLHCVYLHSIYKTSRYLT